MGLKEKLSIRTVDEIMAMQFDQSGYFLVNGIFTKGNPLTIVGPSGVGKTRFVLQLAVCVITGKPFIGLPVQQQVVRWLFLQNENNARRFQYELNNIQPWLTKKEWNLVRSHMLFQVLLREQDYSLTLRDPYNIDLIADSIRQHKPGVLVCDPLSAFALGSLNTDTGMLGTCRSLAALAREGDPNASLVILHHTLQGKAGIRKAAGFDRGSYGRGSGALHTWTRGQFNIAPANADNSDRLVIVCGKNSNGPGFTKFGAVRDPSSGMYEVDPSFDPTEWQSTLAGTAPAANATHRLNAAAVAELVGPVGRTKGELVASIMTEYGVEKTRAYEVIGQAESTGLVIRDARKVYRAATAP